MIEEAQLSERDLKLYNKLHASCSDLNIARDAARYILQKGWHTFSFRRRGTVRIQQIAFTTTLIVAYARPFSGGGNLSFPERLLQYDAQEKALHNRLLTLRKKQYAHTDASHYKVTPLKHKFITDISSIRDERFSAAELNVFLRMTERLDGRIRDRLQQLRAESNDSS